MEELLVRNVQFLFIGAVAGLCFATRAPAVYLGLQVTLQQVALQNGTVMNQYRVYGSFSDPNDYLVAVAGSPTVGNIVLQSRNADDTGAGSMFYNPPGGIGTPPSLATIALNPDVEHDTFCTIGIIYADQAINGPVHLSPGFTGIGSVTELNTNNAGWIAEGGLSEQGRAGWLGDGDPLLRVLIMQLTVSSTSNVRGTVAISGVNQLPQGGQSFTIANQTFNSIPAPGIVPALAAFALATSRRRRDV
jgi:hypothetical protein